MPTIHVMHHSTGDNVKALLRQLCEGISEAAGITPDKVWAFWHPVDPSCAWRADWNNDGSGGPLVRIFCRRSHSREKVGRIVFATRSILAAVLGCEVSRVFVQVMRVDDEEVFSVG